MKIKVSEATPLQLNWMVAKCWDVEVEYINDGITRCLLKVAPFTGIYAPSTNWSQGGPIIEREEIETRKANSKEWGAWKDGVGCIHGPTPLIAAMRCYVASKLGDEVEIPEELK